MYQYMFLSNNTDNTDDAVLVTTDDVVPIPDVQEIEILENQTEIPQSDSTVPQTSDSSTPQDEQDPQDVQESEPQNPELQESQESQESESELTTDTSVPTYTLDDIHAILTDIEKNQDTLIGFETEIRDYQRDSIVLQKFANTMLFVLIFILALLSGVLFARAVFRKF